MSNGGELQPLVLSRGWHTCLKLASMLALITLLAARALGPSDLWDHTQVRTVSYTTDIIINGGVHWVLPIERGEVPATKPPLYNWLAVPMVMWLGFNSEIAHRFPSIAAICVCWLVVVRLGNAIDRTQRNRPVLGWLAGLALVTNYSMFKLGYLARPDMLLTLWFLLGWIASTRLIIDGEALRPVEKRLLVIGFWTCVVLSAMTKGPAALPLPVYGFCASWALGGSWRAVRVLHPAWGLSITAAVVSLWVYGVWWLEPDHLLRKLMFDEVVGRITGTGSEGNRHGSIGLLIDLPLHAIYFVLRFLPWSIPALATIRLVVRSRRSGGGNPWLVASTLFVLIVVGLFTLSAGKRADYIAGAMPACAILAGWWLLNGMSCIGIRWPWLAPVAGALTMAGIIIHEQLDRDATQPDFGNAIRQFIDESATRIASEPLPGGVVFCWTGETQLQAMLGSSQFDGKEAVFTSIERGQPFWVLAGRKTSEPHEFAQWLRTRRQDVHVEPILESAKLPRKQGWPEQVTLYRLTPQS